MRDGVRQKGTFNVIRTDHVSNGDVIRLVERKRNMIVRIRKRHLKLIQHNEAIVFGKFNTYREYQKKDSVSGSK